MLTSLYAAVLALFYLYLSVCVIRQRVKNKVALGQGSDEKLIRAIRVHANFAEFVPLILILAVLSELQDAPVWCVHLVCGALLAGRVVHAFGLSKENEKLAFRQIGMVFTFIALISGAVTNLVTYLW